MVMRDETGTRDIPRGGHLKVLLAISVLAIFPAAVNAVDLAGLPTALADKIKVAEQACADVHNGEFALEWGAVTRTDLDGDLYPDWVLDESAFSCSTDVSLFCSTGGCMSHFLVDGAISAFLNHGWTVFTYGRNPVLLTRVHGTNCGGNNPAPCFIARSWDSDAKVWRSLEAHAE